MNGEAGKGDTYRPVDKKRFDLNYERIFGKGNNYEPSKQSKSKNFGARSKGKRDPS